MDRHSSVDWPVETELAAWAAIRCQRGEQFVRRAILEYSSMELVRATGQTWEKSMADFKLVEDFKRFPELRPLADRLSSCLEGISSEDTRYAIEQRFGDFLVWAESADSDGEAAPLSLPIEASMVTRYMMHLESRELSLASIRVHVSTISVVHRDLGLPNPTRDPLVKDMMSTLTRRHAGNYPRKARPLTEREIKRILGRLRRPRTREERQEPKLVPFRAALDKALLLTMIQAGLKWSEVAELRWRDITEQPDGTGRIRLPTKWDHPKEVNIAVTSKCVLALVMIKPDNFDDEDYVFDLSKYQVSRRLKRMCEEAGINPSEISGNTPRSTLVNSMHRRGAPIDVIQRQARLKHPVSVLSYLRVPAAEDSLQWLES